MASLGTSDEFDRPPCRETDSGVTQLGAYGFRLAARLRDLLDSKSDPIAVATVALLFAFVAGLAVLALLLGFAVVGGW